jgi:hypothetical protein
MKKSSAHEAYKAIIAFLLMLLGLAIVLIFQTNQDNIIESNNFHTFFGLTVIGLGLFLGLIYLVNQSGSTPTKKKKR